MKTPRVAIFFLIPLLALFHLECLEKRSADPPGSRTGTGAATGGDGPGTAAADSGPHPGPEPAAPALSARYDFNAPSPTMIHLPSKLREISGIVFLSDSILLAHEDESGRIFEIDPSGGRVVRQFSVGHPLLRDDFEDIAVADDTVWLVTGGGELFAFREGRPADHVAFLRFRTGLTKKNDVEGLCFDPATRTLLLACKASPGVEERRTRAVYEFDLLTRRLKPRPRFILRLDELVERFHLDDFAPSGIARHPVSGNFFLISAAGRSLIELSPEGLILDCVRLSGKIHRQTEGLAFDARGNLYLSDEGPARGTIAFYPAGG